MRTNVANKAKEKNVPHKDENASFGYNHKEEDKSSSEDQLSSEAQVQSGTS